MLFSGIGLGVSAVFFLACQVVTPVFVRLFYPDLTEAVSPLLGIVNLTQILSLLSAYLFIIVLTFTGEKWQLGLQCGHLVLLLILIAVMMRGSLIGFSAAVLIANAARIIAVLILGFVQAGKA